MSVPVPIAILASAAARAGASFTPSPTKAILKPCRRVLMLDTFPAGVTFAMT